MPPTPFETLIDYHEATKHHFHRYARSAGAMDWANQPDPFRAYDGADQIPLPLAPQDPEWPYDALFTAPEGEPTPLDLAAVGLFLELSLGLSAWKAAGTSRWSLRINPSSGNLHPTEGHLVLPDIPGLAGGVFHYSPLRHGLERRLHLPKGCWSQLSDHFRGPGFLAALSTIFWRESWKYGERAYRYCNLDVGHALAAISFAARLQGWKAVCLTGAGDDQIRALLGFTGLTWPPGGAEEPELLCWIATAPRPGHDPQQLPKQWERFFLGQTFSGRPNPLSPRHVAWPIIDAAALAGEKPETTPGHPAAQGALPAVPAPPEPVADSAATVLRRRRSAVRFDSGQSISAATFFSILSRTLFKLEAPPFSVRLGVPDVNLLLFVHRVKGLSPGLYLLGRESEVIARYRKTWRKDLLWRPAHEALPFWLLKRADVTNTAMEVSCHQEIAADSAFAVAMVARFKERIASAAAAYRRLYWECGMIGQVLYLEAEARGLRGTGIGCFFDDPVHELLGIKDLSNQSLYHFTVGHPIEDTRLATLPAYHHLER